MRFAPHLQASDFPGVSITVELYVLGGVRSVEIGSLMLGHIDAQTGEEVPGPRELVRLALPRRTHTQSHVDYVIEVVGAAYELREQLCAYRIVEQAPALRHFTARLAPASADPAAL
jgi:tryptophanase